MDEPNSTESPLEAAAGAAGSHTVDAFKQLSNEIRLAILLALWEAHDPHGGDDAVPFSELYDQVDVDDSGNFTYHLDKLTGHFVAETEDGYQLRTAGITLVQAVIAGTGLGETTLSPTELDVSCQYCGAPVVMSYDDERLDLVCKECEGKFGPDFRDGIPAGTLASWDVNPAGLTHRTPGEIFVAAKIQSLGSLWLSIRGVCPQCSGATAESVHICETHESAPGEVCRNCGTKDEVRVHYVCSVCKYGQSYPVDAALHNHPAIVAFCHEHGIELSYDVDDPESCERLNEHHQVEREHALVSTDPIRISVTVPGDDEKLELTLDGDLDVIDVSRSRV